MPNYVYLITVADEGGGLFAATCPDCVIPTTNHFAQLDNGAEGCVAHVIYIDEHSEEYRLIAAIAPIFEVTKLWHLDWQKEEPHADP